MSDNIIARNKIEIAVDGSGVDAGIAKIDRSIKGLSRSASDAGKQAGKGLGEIGNGGASASANVDKATKNIINSIQRQTAAFTAGKRGSAEYYQSIAALKGANLDALKPYIAQLKEAQNNADKLALSNSKVTSSLGGMASSLSITKTLLGGVVASLAAVSFVGLAKGALDYADSINDVAKSNEVAVSSVLKLANALQLNGGQSESASKLFSSLTSKLDEAAEGSEKAQKQFRLVGITLKDLKTLDGQALFEKTLAGLSAIEDPIKRNAVAMDLLGKAAKGVDINGLANDYANSQQDFTDAEKKFNEIADAMDKVDAATGKLKLNIAQNLAPWYSTTITYLDDLIFGWSKLEEQIRKAGGSSQGAFKAAPTLKDKPELGAFNLPNEYKGNVREVIDANAGAIKKGQDDAAKAQQDAIKKAKESRDKANDEVLKDIQFQLGFELELLEAKNKTEIDLVKEVQKAKDEAYKDDLKQLAIRQQIANDNFQEAQKESQRLEDDRAKEFEKSMDGINQVFREGFANMVNGGKGTWKSFTKSLVTTFKTTVADTIYKMFAQPFIVKIVASLLGVGASGAASASGGIVDSITGGGGGIFSTISDGLSSINTNVVGSIEKLGAFLSNGQGGLGDTIGGFLGEYASQVGVGLAFIPTALKLFSGDVKGAAIQGGFTAAGAYLGSVIPGLGTVIGAGIGSFLGGAIGGLFGKDKTKHPVYIGSASSTFESGKLSSSFGTLAGAGKEVKSLGANSSLEAVNKAFSESLSALMGGFGENQKITTSIRLWKRKAALGWFDASFGDGASINLYSDLGRGDASAAFQVFFKRVLGEGIVSAIQKTKLPEGIKELFRGLSDPAQVTNMINASLALGSAQDELASRFGLTASQAGKVSIATGLVGDDLAKFAVTLAQSAGAFKTVGDVLVAVKSKLSELLGGSVPESLKSFDDVLKGIDKTTQAGIDSFTAMFSLRDQFAAFTKSLDDLKGGVRGALYGIVSDTEKQAMMNADLSKAFGELGLSVPTSIEELITLGKSIDFTTKSGIDLASVFPSLVSAFNQTASSVETLMNKLRDVNEFTTIVDFNRYKGLATNYGNTFANQITDGKAVSYGNASNTSVSVNPLINASNNTTISTSDPNLLQAIYTLSAKVDALQLEAAKTATQSKRAADVLVNVSPNGNAIQTEALV